MHQLKKLGVVNVEKKWIVIASIEHLIKIDEFNKDYL